MAELKENKVILSCEGFDLLKKLEYFIKKYDKKINKNVDFLASGGKLTEKQKETLNELKEDRIVLKKIHEIFNDIITENSYLLVFLQNMSNIFANEFPIEIKKLLMPTQIKALEQIRQDFQSIKEIYNKYTKK